MLAALALPMEKGRIKVDDGMEIPGNPGVWALGDCALVKQVDGNFSPPTAQHALRQAKTCARNILASARGAKKEVFTFTGLGKLSSLGRRSAVAEIFGIRLKGLVAWLLWRGVYVTKFPGLRESVEQTMSSRMGRAVDLREERKKATSSKTPS